MCPLESDFNLNCFISREENKFCELGFAKTKTGNLVSINYRYSRVSSNCRVLWPVWVWQHLKVLGKLKLAHRLRKFVYSGKIVFRNEAHFWLYGYVMPMHREKLTILCGSLSINLSERWWCDYVCTTNIYPTIGNKNARICTTFQNCVFNDVKVLCI